LQNSASHKVVIYTKRGKVCAEPYAQYKSSFRGSSVLPKTQLNNAFLLEICFNTMRREEIHNYLKIDADTLNRRQCRFCVRRTVYHMYQGQCRQSAGKSACVYCI